MYENEEMKSGLLDLAVKRENIKRLKLVKLLEKVYFSEFCNVKNKSKIIVHTTRNEF